MMPTRQMPSCREAASLDTRGLRAAFLLEDLFVAGQISLVYTDLDRAIVGIINLGEPGSVRVDGCTHQLARHDCLYVGRGSREIRFASAAAASPAVFYLVSYPAHASYATVKATRADANRVELGSSDEANERTIFQYIHEAGIKSCQLVMGFTEFKSGSVWNTMPCHTHARRSEVYCYFDLPPEQRVVHLMGEPQETRPLWVAGRQVVLSPPWSIHCGHGRRPRRSRG